MEKCNTCMHGYPSIECVNCGISFRNYLPYTPPTNADRIRRMSDKELAKILVDADYGVLYEEICGSVERTRVCDNDCEICVLEWLRQPAKEES